MAKLDERPNVTTKIVLELSEGEARALYALTEFGADNFLMFFYKHLGDSGLKPYEVYLQSLFDSVRVIMPPIFDRLKAARAVFDKGQTK